MSLAIKFKITGTVGLRGGCDGVVDVVAGSVWDFSKSEFEAKKQYADELVNNNIAEYVILNEVKKEVSFKPVGSSFVQEKEPEVLVDSEFPDHNTEVLEENEIPDGAFRRRGRPPKKVD